MKPKIIKRIGNWLITTEGIQMDSFSPYQHNCVIYKEVLNEPFIEEMMRKQSWIKPDFWEALDYAKKYFKKDN
jgi:hypothetical protein